MHELPGRFGNLYKTRLYDIQSGISVIPQEHSVKNALCREAITGQNMGMNACFGGNFQKRELVPARRAQYDLLVEKALYPQFVRKYNKKDKNSPWLIVLVVLVILYLTKR